MKAKEEWRKARCPQCDYVIEFRPKESFDGKLRCPDCGKWFKTAPEAQLNDYF